MNPLLAELHRRYRATGIPRLEVQTEDLGQLVAARKIEITMAAMRALAGYARHRAAMHNVRSIWEPKRGLRSGVRARAKA